MSRRTVGRLGLLAWAVVLVGWAGAARAQNGYAVSASIQPERGITDADPVRLIVHVELPPQAERVPDLVAPSMRGLVNLSVRSGPAGQFTSSYVNGRVSKSYALTYTLVPRQAGEAEVPALELSIDGVTYRTEPIRFSVAAAPAVTGPPRRGDPRRAGREAQADVFLRAELGKREAWVGEPISLSLTLYTAEQVSNAVLSTEPTLRDFWVEELEVDPEGDAFTTSVDGRPYRAYPILRRIVVPQTAGSFEIDPWVIQLEARVRSNDPFDFSFFGRRQTIVRRSEPLTLRVEPLPAAGRPQGFEFAVGRYELRAAVDRQEARVNDAVALRAVVEGEGLLKLSGPPVFETPSELKVLEPKITESFESRGGRILSRKSWEWIVIPLTPGEMELPELRFPFFDPAAGTYRVASARLAPLVVRRAGPEAETLAGRADLQIQRRDIEFIKALRGPLRERTPRAHERPVFIALLLSPLAWGPALIVLGRRRERLERDRGLARSRRARARARRRLQAARKRMEQLDSVTFHQDVARALVEYVGDRFDRSAAGLTYDAADELLAGRDVAPELRRRLRACLETCDFARFVPAAGKSERRLEVLAEAGAIVDELERAL